MTSTDAPIRTTQHNGPNSRRNTAWTRWVRSRVPATVIALATCSTVHAAGQPSLLVTISSRNAGTVGTVDLRVASADSLTEVAELKSELSAIETCSGVAAFDLDTNGYDDYLLIVHPVGGLTDELQWFEFRDCHLEYRDTLLQFIPSARRILAVAAGNLDNDADVDVLTLELFSGDWGPRLWHYEFSGGALTTPVEIIVPTSPTHQLVTMALTDWDSTGGNDIIMVEHELSELTDLTHVNHYAFAAGQLTLEAPVLTADGWLHNFRSVSPGRIDGSADPGLIMVDSVFYDSSTAVEQWEIGLTGSLELTDFALITIPAAEKLLGGIRVPLPGADCNENSIPDDCQITTGSDFDNDGDVDSSDFTWFAACLNGPGAAPGLPSAECGELCQDAFDADTDGDVDLQDFGAFATIFEGPNL